ncbi:MAG TPA: ABC transporter ATP-binding protein [Plantibacter sp.]|uniref:ABC transporter ATP-binding protein n=1 Tax=Plantibacter sp. TaxID=1871045 RepID=UPI002C6EDE7C|nr:ABC transporter ATP-binding protein [Plantibacter sp.]
MSTSASTSRSRNPFSRQKDDGPRASLKQLMPYIFEHRSILIVVIILSIVGAAASLAQPLIVSQVIGVVEAGRSLGNLAWLLVGLVVVSGVISGYQHYLLQRAGTGVVYSSRRQLIARIFRLPISQFDTRRTGDLVSRVGSDTTMLYAVLTQGFVDAVGGAVTFLGALIAMAIIDPVLLGLTLLVVIVSVVVVVALSGRIRVASREQQTKVGELAAAVERAISSIRTIRASNATDREIDAVDGVAKEVYGVGVRIAKISSLVVPVAGIAMQTSFLVVLGVGGFRVASGAITIASLVAFILFLFMMIMPLGQAFGAITSVNQALGALGRIQEILDLPDEGDDDASIAARVERPGTATAAAPTIEFDGVEFAYPDAAVIERERAAAEALATDVLGAPARTTEAIAADAALLTEASSAAGRQVLRGVSFGAMHGRRTALVGPSGAGKSTILGLIERFYDPTAGAIRLGGVDIRTIPRAELRAQIGYVEQDAPVLAGTLRDNLLLSSPTATDDECARVLHAVNLGAVLDRNPLGLSAPVGEDGIMLSGGERQRLAIARALLAAPPILLLDESTSSLDGVNEQMMREAIDAVAADRTLIVIAHRLSTVVDSDQIVVLDEGRVIGVGTHSELVTEVPLYRELAKHQLLV